MSALIVHVPGAVVQLRACRLHPDVFAPPGHCPLCLWARNRFRPAPLRVVR